MNINDIIKILGSTLIGGFITLFTFYKTAWQRKDKELADILKEIRHDISEHGLHISIHQQNHENLADRHETRFKFLENKVNQFENIVPEVNALKLEMKAYTQKMDNLIEVVKESKADNKETIKEIKEMFRNKGH